MINHFCNISPVEAKNYRMSCLMQCGLDWGFSGNHDKLSFLAHLTF